MSWAFLFVRLDGVPFLNVGLVAKAFVRRNIALADLGGLRLRVFG